MEEAIALGQISNAFALRGARPVFVDVREDTLNMDERLLEAAITPRTRAIVPVHYGGIGCDMEAIGDIAARHGIGVVEDNAHGLFGKRAGRNLAVFPSTFPRWEGDSEASAASVRSASRRVIASCVSPFSILSRTTSRIE